MSLNLSRILLVTTVLLYGCDCSKILIMFPFPARSHHNLGNGYIKYLLEAGHQITYITPYQISPHPNLTQIDVSAHNKLFRVDLLTIKSIVNKEIDLYGPTLYFFRLLKLAKAILENDNVKTLFNSDAEFDLVIAERMFTDIYSGIQVIYNCPFIWVFSFEPDTVILSLIDAPPNPAYTPSIDSSYLPPFTFTQRLIELWEQVKINFLHDYYFFYFEKQLYEDIFSPIVAKKGRTLPPYSEAIHNISLVFSSMHISYGEAKSLPPNFKAIGGYHVDTEVKPLRSDLQKIMDNAKYGVIYFSMGSNLKSRDWPENIRKELLEMFSSLKQVVLWKFEEELSDVPPNVHILLWAPQQSILAHPNCILFITHGGLLSTIESLHFGVPIIGIPLFTDQFNNVNRAVQRGFAKRVDAHDKDIARKLKSCIEDMIHDPTYMERTKQLSFIYHHRPVSPSQELVHWVEHVIRTNGAVHLRSAALLVPWYQRQFLDLAVIVVILFILLVLVIRRLLKYVYVDVNKKND